MEYFGQYIQLFARCDGFDAGNNGHIDSSGPAFVYEVKVMLVVEEHLGNQEFCACIYFPFEVTKVGFHVGCIRVFFGVTGSTGAEVRFTGIGDFLVQINTRIHVLYLVNEVECVFVAVFFGLEIGISFAVIAPQSQDVVDAQETQFNEGVFGIFF